MTAPKGLEGIPEAEEPRRAHRHARSRRGSGWRRIAVVTALAVVLLAASAGSAASWRSPTRPTAGNQAQCLAVGASITLPGQWDGPDLQLFRQAQSQLGPLTMRRSFEPVLPPSFASSSAAGDAAAGLRSFVSWKPPKGDYRGAAAGAYDSQMTAWASSAPHTGVFATVFHEPENNMRAADFVALQRHVYTVVKRANPSIQFGPVYMAYWWDPREPSHYVGDPSAWWPGEGYADFAALDWYGPDPEPMTTSRSFTNWYHVMAPKGLPLLIPEYGQYLQPAGQPRDHAKEHARARAIRQDAVWLLAHPQFVAWIYWNSGDAAGSWRMHDHESQLAWRSVAVRGCRS